MLLITFSTLLLLAFGFSWFAFFQATKDPSLVYLPLENYFFSNKVTEASSLYARPDFYISNFDFKPALSDKIIYEVFVWLLVLVSAAIFIRLIAAHEWFITKKKTTEPMEIFKKTIQMAIFKTTTQKQHL